MGWIGRLRNLTRRQALNRDLEREMSFHVAERVDDLVAQGMTENEARSVARRRFGNYTLHRERTRDMDIHGWIETVAHDVRYGLRMIRKSPIFAMVVVLSLAIGLGANATLSPYAATEPDAALGEDGRLEGARSTSMPGFGSAKTNSRGTGDYKTPGLFFTLRFYISAR